MGGLFLKDELEALKGVSDFDLFTAADVDYAFGRMHTLKHKQYHRLQGKQGCCIQDRGFYHTQCGQSNGFSSVLAMPREHGSTKSLTRVAKFGLKPISRCCFSCLLRGSWRFGQESSKI